jgi:hypothetical protein
MTRSILIAAGLALAGTLAAVSAQAQAIRTFVSTTGSDSNPCSITAPCRHFSAAVTATAPGGEVDALDPGAYGSFTISQAISIEGEGWSYVAPPANGAAITINAVSGDIINIRGVSLNGVAASNATGIQFNSGTTLNLQNSVIRNFSTSGISFVPTSGGQTQVFVSNTLVSNNGTGIFIQPSSVESTSGVLEHVELENNANFGLFIYGDSGLYQPPFGFSLTINITVTDSVSANNGHGIYAISQPIEQGAAETLINIMVRNSTIANNASGLEASGTGAAISVTRSTITENTTAWAASSSGAVLSYGDNNIDGNGGSTKTAPPCVNGTSPCSAYK